MSKSKKYTLIGIGTLFILGYVISVQLFIQPTLIQGSEITLQNTYAHHTNDIWEARVQLGNNIFRFLGFLENDHLVVLNHAFQKKTHKTPIKEIRLAEERKREYLNRKSLS